MSNKSQTYYMAVKIRTEMALARVNNKVAHMRIYELPVVRYVAESAK